MERESKEVERETKLSERDKEGGGRGNKGKEGRRREGECRLEFKIKTK